MNKFEYVSYLNVSLTSGNDRASLYANSQSLFGNQVAINVTFMVTDKYYNQVILTEDEIKKCVCLGDYHTGDILIPDTRKEGWETSTIAGDYVTSDVVRQSTEAGANYQSIIYYASCYDYLPASRTFCAVITPDNGYSIATSAKGTQFDSGVTLTPLPAIYYDYNQLDFVRIDTQNKTYGKYVVDQDNYYISIPGGTFKKNILPEPYIYAAATADKNHPPLVQIEFPIGPQATYDLVMSDGTIIPIPYNERAGQQCLSRVTIQNYTVSRPSSYDINLDIKDIYGNDAFLKISPSDDNNTISISNA